MFSIRKATAEDIPLIRELTFQVWPQTYAPILSPDQIGYMLQMMYSASSLERQMKDGSHFLLIYDGNEPVGFAAYFETDPLVFKLDKIYILPSQQGKGTGKFLINHIIEEIRKRKAKALQLQVNRHNSAKNFYEKLGFFVIDEKDFDIGEGYYMNDFVMEKKM